VDSRPGANVAELPCVSDAAASQQAGHSEQTGLPDMGAAEQASSLLIERPMRRGMHNASVRMWRYGSGSCCCLWRRKLPRG
jgi:hypothetical protein